MNCLSYLQGILVVASDKRFISSVATTKRHMLSLHIVPPYESVCKHPSKGLRFHMIKSFHEHMKTKQ